MRHFNYFLWLLLLLNISAFGQYDKGGIKAVGSVAVMQLDTNAREIIRIIENERIAGGGIAFTMSEKIYVNSIVLAYKESKDVDGISAWQKSLAIWGMVGGTADSHKWNWKDMRDVDAAFSLDFLGGGWVHSSTGAKPNGISSYAETYFNPFVNLVYDNSHLSYYSGTDLNVGTVEIGVTTGDPYFGLITRFNGSARFYSSSVAGQPAVRAVSSSIAYFLGSRLGSTILLSINGSTSTSANTNTTAMPNLNMRLGSGAGTFSSKECRLASVGYGLSTNQSTSLSDRIYKAQVFYRGQ